MGVNKLLVQTTVWGRIWGTVSDRILDKKRGICTVQIYYTNLNRQQPILGLYDVCYHWHVYVHSYNGLCGIQHKQATCTDVCSQCIWSFQKNHRHKMSQLS